MCSMTQSAYLIQRCFLLRSRPVSGYEQPQQLLRVRDGQERACARRGNAGLQYNEA
jgi:hypothetical protein